MLEDVQERLVYRTHIYIQTDITGYKPAPGDLAYPDKLVMMEVGLFICSLLPHTLGMSYTDIEYKTKCDCREVIGMETKELNTDG